MGCSWGSNKGSGYPESSGYSGIYIYKNSLHPNPFLYFLSCKRVLRLLLFAGRGKPRGTATGMALLKSCPARARRRSQEIAGDLTKQSVFD